LLAVGNGGTGISATPSYGQLLVGNCSGTYTLVATSLLGIASGGGTPGGSDTQARRQRSARVDDRRIPTDEVGTCKLHVCRIQTERAAKTCRRSTLQMDDGSFGGRSSRPALAGMNARGGSETIGPSFCLPPVESWRGTSPTSARGRAADLGLDQAQPPLYHPVSIS
jgi:hypothetical protein